MPYVNRRAISRRLSSCLMFDPMLMHLPVYGSSRLVERTLQECLMVHMPMMMRNCSRLPLRRAAADVLQAAIEQGEHVVRGLRAEEIVWSFARDIDWRSVRHDSPAPGVVMLDCCIVWAAAAGA